MAANDLVCNFTTNVLRVRLQPFSDNTKSSADLENLTMRLLVGKKTFLEFEKFDPCGQRFVKEKVFQLDLGNVQVTVRFIDNEVHFRWLTDVQQFELIVDLPEKCSRSQVRPTYHFELNLRSLRRGNLKIERVIRLSSSQKEKFHASVEAILVSQTFKNLKPYVQRVLDKRPTLADNSLSQKLQFCDKNHRELIDSIKLHLRSKK